MLMVADTQQKSKREGQQLPKDAIIVEGLSRAP